MTRQDALKAADEIIQRLVTSGDEAIFAAARDASGAVDHAKLVAACMRAREKLADKIMTENGR